jgi:hypothetical protein
MNVLDQLVGTWDVTFDHTQMPELVSGTSQFERVLDGKFVMSRSAMEHPDVPDAISMMSGDRSYYFDTRGVVRIYEIDLTDDAWTLTLVGDDFSQKIVNRLTSPDTVETDGYLSDDRGANWEPDFTATMHRRMP